jgi:hypothetical protein
VTGRTRTPHALASSFTLALLMTGATLTGCTNHTTGSASFTVTYTSDESGEPVTETVAMDTTDCDATPTAMVFGEDVSLSAQADYMKQVDDNPAAVRGYLPGAVSGEVGLDSSGPWYLVITLADGSQFYSIEPFEADRDGFALTDHPGKIVGRSIWADTEVVATAATATGTFTC